MCSKLLISVVLWFFFIYVGAQDVSSAEHQRAIATCDCIKASLEKNSKKSFNNCFGTGISGSPSNDKFLSSGQKNTVYLGDYLFEICPESWKGFQRFYRFPTNFEEFAAKKLNKKKKYKKWLNENIAFYGFISKIKETEVIKYYQIKIGDEFIWMVFPIINDRFLGNIGDTIKAIGTITFSDPSESSFIDNSEYYISIFGFINLNEEDIFYDPAYEKNIQLWKEGELPLKRN